MILAAGLTAPQHGNEGRLAFERDNALGPASGPDEAARQTAGPGAQLEDRTRARQVDAAGDSIGEPCAARFGSGDAQGLLQPKSKEDTRVSVHSVSRFDRLRIYSKLCVLQF